MNNQEIIRSTEDFVKGYMTDKEAGHNWWHIERVRNNAHYIYSIEKRGDPFIIELAALLHDIGDDKIDADTDGIMLVRSFLSEFYIENRIIDSVTEIMAKISFRDNFESKYDRSIELDIVQDADRIDAIGAIGIARAFSYGGSKGNDIYNPDQPRREYNSKSEYTASDSSTINHFYEKLLKLRDMMNTATGRSLAEERHQYMKEYLERFYKEWGIGIVE